MRDAKTILEFAAVKKQLAEFAYLGFTKQRIMEMDYSTDYFHILEELNKTNEALSIVNSFGRCPIEYIHDLSISVDKAMKQGVLSPEELYRIGSQSTGMVRMKSFFNSLKSNQYPEFEYYINTLHPLKDLKARIDLCITPSFEIYDNASSALAKIRREISVKSSEIRRKMESIIRSKATYLADNLITMRNDRLVIPVKAAYKNALNGIIHDESASQQTVYVEPEAAILLNSQIAALKQQENLEIERILRELTKLVAVDGETLLRNQRMIEEIDFMFAKGAYGISIDALVAELSQEQIINLRGAKHPLIDKKVAVANDFSLGGEDNLIYLITGPNTGGKTVALKTVGIIALMNQCGLAIPCNFASRLGIFDDFYVDIGDDQSIEQSLSTFSSHISKLTEMVQKANDKSLVLIDEVGGGTNPQEGEAIAMAVISQFHRCQSIVLATTHYANLKTFAIEQGYVTNASMIFDSTEMKPTYKLLKGVSGKSYAFEIATNLGFPLELINEAKNYRKHYMSKSDELIEQLEGELEEVNHQKELIEKQKEETKQEYLAAEEYKDKLKKEELKIKENADEEIDKLVVDAMQSVEDVLNDLKNNDDLKLHQVINAKARINALKPEIIEDEVTQAEKPFEVGDYAYVISAKRRGKIERKNGDAYLVNIGGISLKVKGSNLQHTEEKSMEIVEKKMMKAEQLLHVPMELNLIGMHVDEALEAVDKYLDNAMRVRLKTVRIIHGFGSGALRNAVQKYLKGKSNVKEFHYGGAYDGGMGATVVVFKD